MADAQAIAMLDRIATITENAEDERRSLTDAEKREIAELESGARTLIEQAEKRAHAARERAGDILGMNGSRSSRSFFDAEWRSILPSLSEYRALSESVNADGGFLVPQETADTIHDKLRAKSVFLAAGPNIEPMGSSGLVVPQVANSGAVGIVAEGTTIPAHTLTFGGNNLNAKKYASLLKASFEVLEDNAVGLRNRIAPLMIADLSTSMDTDFLASGGTDVVGVSGQATQSALSAAVTWDDIADALSTVEGNGADARVRIILGTAAAKALRKEKASGTGNYLFGPQGKFAGEGWGSRILVTANTPNPNDALIADFAEVTVGKRSEVQVAVSTEAAFDTDEVAYRLRARYAGVILHDANAAVYLDGSAVV